MWAAVMSPAGGMSLVTYLAGHLQRQLQAWTVDMAWIRRRAACLHALLVLSCVSTSCAQRPAVMDDDKVPWHGLPSLLLVRTASARALTRARSHADSRC